MTIPTEVQEAVKQAVEEQGQTPGLAMKINKWLDVLGSGSETLDDRESVKRHLDVLFEATVADVDMDVGEEG